ncbi:MAG TPA: UDP-N-acetylmuramoyl-tripeptide--D-alanyl-D-alanine ligase [Clostridia bacterium]|nr:UDP-N-acetylmuramoyl-tripeptide--D-alanyl-D-alanine ligase [Clostridia bacterium]
MEDLSIGEITASAQGTLVNSDRDFLVNGVSIDSRRINPGNMFIALKGESFDGHDFISTAIENGAAVVVTQKPLNECSIPYILVGDTLKALQDIARYYRGKFQIPFVAVTGSSGKTTTKDMIASVLSQKFNVLKTEGNFNNAIGLPLTLLKLQYDHEIAILEMGMNSPGEISLLSDIVRQDIAVISNVGNAHIEKLGSRENILKAKLEVFDYFDSSSTAVINGDNDMLSDFSSEKYRVIRYGLEKSNDLYAFGIKEKGEDGIDFEVNKGGASESFTVLLPGMHNVYNALSAIAVARLFDMKGSDIRKGLLSFKPSKMRMDIINTSNGVKIINDAYNANPESMKAAINVLQSLKAGGKSVCITGDMLELGDASEGEHYNIGAYAAEIGVDIIVAIGNFSDAVKKGAEDSGMSKNNLYAFLVKDEAASTLDKIIRPGDVVLVKGSRVMKMENIVDLLRERG